MLSVDNISQSRALVVAIDDDELILSLYKAALQDMAEVYTFANPADGLAFILQSQITVAIIDRSFPRFPMMNGDEVCKELRQQPRTQTLPIIIVSGLDEIEEITEIMRQHKIDTYLTKPIEVERLRNQVHFYIRQTQVQALPAKTTVNS